MPTYGYECKSCGHAFDYFQSMRDEPLKTCPECGKDLRRLINGGTGIIFKGGGFYVTDKSAGAGKSGDAQAPKTKADTPCAGCPANAGASGGAINGGAINGGAINGGGKPDTCPKAVNS